MPIITNLLTNMLVVGSLGLLPTNYNSKPAFQRYAFDAMFQQASNLAVTWNLDLPRPITTNIITSFKARYCAGEGIIGGIHFRNRFAFGWTAGKLNNFQDKLYIEMNAATDDVDRNDALFEKWMRATNHLTMDKACIIAESAMRSVVMPGERWRFGKPDHMTQMTYEWKDGKKYPMPLYRFRWGGSPGWPDYEVQVSGITSNVLQCHFVYDSPCEKSIDPTNYIELLGLPPNPIFVHRLYRLPGKPPTDEIYTNYLRSEPDKR
jgi:hypothetical protein